MPPAPGNGRLGPRKPKAKPKYTVTVPDAKESTRSRQSTVPTPDQADRSRTAPQKVRDRAAVAETLRRTRSMPKAKPTARIVVGGGKARTTGPVSYVPA